MDHLIDGIRSSPNAEKPIGDEARVMECVKLSANMRNVCAAYSDAIL